MSSRRITTNEDDFGDFRAASLSLGDGGFAHTVFVPANEAKQPHAATSIHDVVSTEVRHHPPLNGKAYTTYTFSTADGGVLEVTAWEPDEAS